MDYWFTSFGCQSGNGVTISGLEHIKFKPQTLNCLFEGTVFNAEDSSFDLSAELEKLDTSNVRSMEGMFACSRYGIKNMLHGDKKLELKINTSNVTNMNAMFMGAKYLGLTFGSLFDTSKVQTMNFMFAEAYVDNKETLDLSTFDTTSLTDAQRMFAFGLYGHSDESYYPCMIRTIIVDQDGGN